MAFVGRLVVVLLATVAAAGPSVVFSSAETLEPAYNQGLARASDGWVVSGQDVLARLDERLQPVRRVDNAIPSQWAQRGFDHIGDVDISGTTLYVPFEQPDYEQGRQAMARYDARTLTFRDATVVHQHENSFVAVDPTSGIAYSMDRFGGNALLRYDVRSGWRPLTPLRMDRSLDRVQGAAVARDAVWLMTDDSHHGLYRVDINSGAVVDLGSAPPAAGEGEGVDAATIPSGNLHATVVNADRLAVTLDHFRTSGEPEGTPTGLTNPDTSWPPVLVSFAIILAIAALGAVGTVFYRARTTIRPKR
ncbi:MAG: hypothetical protein ACXVJW_20305 [Acidimicrobiia bacterium]